MKSIIFILILLFSISITPKSFSQGCSDAGFCSLGSLNASHYDSMDLKYSNQFKIGGSYGKADHDIAVYGGFLEFHKDVNSCSSFDVRLTYLAQKNDLASSSGLSDLYLNTNWLIVKDLFFTFGCKLALRDGNNDVDGNYLPMDFQTSLGTFDLILGFKYQFKGFQLFLAGQQPLNNNKNKFLAESYPAFSGFRAYQSTNNYRRKGDILFRAAYPFALTEKITVTPSLLPIFHLANDEFTNILGIKESIEGSQGLTLNANLFIDFALNTRNKIELSFGMPLVVRDSRPDGLTRKYVAGLEYGIRF